MITAKDATIKYSESGINKVNMPIGRMLVLSIMAGMFQGSAFLKAASYIPLISCLLSPTLFVMGEVTMVDVTISIVLLIVFLYLIVNYGMKVYKVGILNYSNEKVWTRFVKAFRKED